MITLLHGSEPYLIDRAARTLVEDLRSRITLDFNLEDVQADSMSADQFAEKVGTLPFIDPVRVVVLRELGLLSGKRERGGQAERAAQFLEQITDSTHLVLVLHVVAPSGNPLFKVIASRQKDKQARIDRFDPPRRSDRAGWVRKFAEERGLTITPGAVRKLLERAQPDLALLDQEIAKLALYVHPATRIEEAAVDALVGETREDEIFALTDALAGAQAGAASLVLQSLLDSGREPTYMLYALVGHFRRLLHARAVIDKRGTLQDLQARLADHPFVVEKAFRQAAAYSMPALERAFRELLRIEEQSKLGELDVRIGLEGFILEQSLSAA